MQIANKPAFKGGEAKRDQADYRDFRRSNRERLRADQKSRCDRVRTRHQKIDNALSRREPGQGVHQLDINI